MINTKKKNGHGLAKVLSKGLETEIHYQEISAEEARDLLKAKDFSREKIESLLSMYDSINRLQMLHVNPDYAKITGEMQSSPVDFVKRNRDLFVGKREEWGAQME